MGASLAKENSEVEPGSSANHRNTRRHQLILETRSASDLKNWKVVEKWFHEAFVGDLLARTESGPVVKSRKLR